MLTFLISVFGAGLLSASAALPTPADTVRTELRQGQKHLLHTVKPKENFYSVARHYSVPVQQIKKANPGVVSLQIGQVIYIPVAPAVPSSAGSIPAAKAAKAAPMPAAARTFSVDANGKKWHTVAPGQTLYSISNLFELPIEELQRLNSLKTTDLRAGQVLLVGTQVGPARPGAGQYVPEKDDELEASTKPIVPVKVATLEPAAKPLPEEAGPEAPENATRFTESGLASVINERFRSNKLLALHRTAPIGTVLQVKNSMNGQTVYVRVIGQLPDTGENDKVIVKISKKAYQQLGALDAKFLSEVSYMK